MTTPQQTQPYRCTFHSIPVAPKGFAYQSLAERLLRAHGAMTRGEHNLFEGTEPRKTDLWDGLIEKELSELAGIINHENPKQLSDYLQHFGQTYIWFGGVSTCVDGYTRNVDPDHVASTYFRDFVRLAESLGVLDMECPESGPQGQNLRLTPERIKELIESTLGIAITPPMGLIHTDGVKLGEAVLHYRHINALYAASRLRALCSHRSRIAEYGGGIGLVSMYSRRFGLADYTMFDLPITLVLAANYLAQALGDDAVCLYGETTRPAAVKLLPFWECANTSPSFFDLTLNQDSFPEISEDILKEYRHQIARTTSRYFLSINHEYAAPLTVNRFMSGDTRYRKLHRHPCHVRRGYVEELYELAY